MKPASDREERVSVLMPCRNAGPYLQAAVRSVLSQPECLELLVADGGSSDGSLQTLEALAAEDPRLRIVSREDAGPADALNQALKAARGTLIGWLNADDLYPTGALGRAVAALRAHPKWLMVYGEGEEFNDDTGLRQRYPTLPAAVGIQGFRSHCFVCQPTVVFRRSMAVLLGPFDGRWRTAFDFDYWLRAFAAFPHRIGYVPHLQGRTRLHPGTITSRERALVALEATALLARQFGSAEESRLHGYAEELRLGLAELPAEDSFQAHFASLLRQASPWLHPYALAALQRDWLMQPSANSTAPLSLPRQLLHAWRVDAERAGTTTPPIQLSSPASLQAWTQRPFGVNLIGHAFEVFGIGEDIRMAARALQTAGVPSCVIDHPAANGAASSDRSLAPLLCTDPSGGPYAFNLVCMAAPIEARWLSQGGFEALRERYTITSWPWETQQWPQPWRPLLAVADELWPSSTFSATALSNLALEAGLPLRVMPMAAELTDPDRSRSRAVRSQTRRRHGLPEGAVLFGHSFDFNSTAIRKNPMAVLEAFQLAFPLPHLPASVGREVNHHPLSEQVALLIKCFPPQRFSGEWQWLQERAAEDSRIHLIAESLPREELLTLYGCCDVFLSLHRSEGFGRGMAEALQLGLDVIATDFGGNTDFCTGPLSHPVSWRQAPIPRGAYPCADGHRWAEPDLLHAAELCRQIAARHLNRADDSVPRDLSQDPGVLATYRERFSFGVVGARYRARLEELWADRETTDARLRWRLDRSPLGW